DLPRIRDPGDRIESDSLTLPFVAEEPERSVFHKRTAQRYPELIVPEGRLRVGLCIEKVPRIQCVVPKEFKCRAVNLVCPRFCDDVDKGPGIALVLSVEVG